MNIIIHHDKFHRVIFRKYRVSKIVKDTQTIRNLLCYYQELACDKYKTEEEFNNILAYNYDAKFKTRLTTFGSYSIIEYSLLAVDPSYINDPLYTLDNLKNLFLECLKPCINNNSFDKDIFERAIEIYESDLLDREDSNQFKAARSLIHDYFKGTLRDFDNNGCLEDLYNITVDDLYEYYKNVEKEESITMMSSKEESKYDLNNITLTPKTNYHFKERNNVDFKVEIDVPTKQCYLGIIYETNTYANDKLFYAMSFLNYFLGGSSSSLLFNIAREKYGLCYSVGSSYLGASGIIIIKAILDKENVDKFLLAINESLLEIEKGNFEIELARNHYLSVFKANIDYQETVFFNYLIDNYFLDNPKTYEDEFLIKSVTKEDILEAVKLLKQTFIHIYGGENND